MRDGAWGSGGGTYQVVVVVVGSCGRETQGGERGLGEKLETEPLWLGFRLQWGCSRWRGVLWGYSPPSHANLWVGMGSEVVM